MNISELIQSYFGADNAARLGQAVGLDANLAQKALSLGLPMQIDALAEHASRPEGQKQILEAITNLPSFGPISEVLATTDGAGNLQRAGELLAPALLGSNTENIVNGVTRQVGGSLGGVQKLMHMALPLLLSLLGRGGVNMGNVGALFGGLRGTLSGLNLGTANLGSPNLNSPPPAPPAPGQTTVTNVTVASVAPGAAALTSNVAGATPASPLGQTVQPQPTQAGGMDDLLDFLKAQFSGANADKIGAAAGFSGNNAGRAVQGALPVILNALVNKGRTESGANDLLRLIGQFGHLSDGNGQLNTSVLGNSAELAKVEGQGRNLLGNLFGNVDELTGRFGTALGGSGSNSGRLLSIMTPLVLGLFGRRVGGMGGGALSTLLGSFGPRLSGLIPAGLTGLTGLLGATALSSKPDQVTVVKADPDVSDTKTPVAPAAVTPAKVETVATPAPRPVTPPPPPSATQTVVTRERKGGFPWWWLLLPLLLLGGCYLLNKPKPADNTPVAAEGAATPATAADIIVENPTSGDNLPADPFTMSGKGPANTELTISDQGQDVAQATVGADGSWSADLPAPTPGEHTYSIAGGDAKSEFKVNVADADAPADTSTTEPAATDTSATDTAAATTGDGTFTISEPAADATLAAGGFDLKGTGQAGDEVEVFEDGTSLGKVTIGDDGNWTYRVASPAAGAHTYSVNGPDGTELGTVATTVEAATGDASACTNDYTLSITDGQTVSEPFRFGGEGGANGVQGYTVTVKRGDRTIGTKDLPLDGACGWSYTSKPGKGAITYEVRPMGDASAEPLSTVNLTVGN